MFSISVGAEWTAQKVSQPAVHHVRINFALEETKIITVPTGYCEFPHEIVRPPRSVAEQAFRDIRRWSVMPRGGHFAAMEEALTNLRIVRGGGHPWTPAEVEEQLKATGFERIETVSPSPSIMFVLGQRPASKWLDIGSPR